MFGYIYIWKNMPLCLDKSYMDISEIMGSADILEKDPPLPVSPLDKVGLYNLIVRSITKIREAWL